MDIIRKELAAGQLYPIDLRYNDATDAVQYTPDGGTTWIDSPQNDPRLNNHYPPPATDDPQCDGAARMTGLLYDYAISIDNYLQAGAAVAEITTATLILLSFIPVIGVLTALIAGTILPVCRIRLRRVSYRLYWTGLFGTALSALLLCQPERNDHRLRILMLSMPA